MNFVNANIIIMWNGTQGSIPYGWSCVSCTAGVDPFTFMGIGSSFVYPRIGNNYCPSDGEIQCGGSPTHAHTLSANSSQPSATTVAEAGMANGVNTGGGTHTHNSVNASYTPSNTSMPPSYSLIFIRANSAIETIIPQGGIVFFNATSPPSGFSMFTSADGYFIIAGNNATRNTIVGQATHDHSNQSIKTGNPSGASVTPVGIKAVSASPHTHLIGSVGWTNGDQTPPYVDLPLIYATGNMTFPTGMIAMFNDTTLSATWSKLNSSDWLGKYLRANSTSFNTTGGSATHSMGSQTFTTGAGAGKNTNLISETTPATSGHTHQVTITTNQTQNNPQYTNITLFMLTSSIANETEGRSAIEQGIYNATSSATIYTDLEVDIRYFNGTQDTGVFDKVSFNGTQRWAFNYVTSGESFTNMASSSYNIFNVWEENSLTVGQIFDAVVDFINNTLI